MSTLLPRAARSAISETSSGMISRALRSQSPALRQSISRSFTTTPRFAATPASPSYARTNTTPSSATPAPATKSTSKASTSSTSSPPTSRKPASPSIDSQSPLTSLTSGMADTPIFLSADEKQVDWSRSFHGLSSAPFAKEAADILMAPIPFDDVEVKPDGIIYLPEIKYRRILNRAFGPGGWGLAPRGETIVTGKSITREYALLAHGRLVSVARGEQDYFSPEGIPTATEGCKSNALMRCCKDLGVASELWDPRYIRTFMKEKAKQIWVEHVPSKKKKQIWLRKDDEVRYPYKESKFGA